MRPVSPARSGPLHALDAMGYSLAGLGRLWQETAMRLELLGGGIALGLFLWRGASLAQWLGLAMLVLAVLAMEALNTAIEVLTDRISPDWSVEAKHAKDLGSLAVGLMIVITVVYVVAVMV